MICDVAVIDYKTATVVAKKQVGKNVAPNVIKKTTAGHTPGQEVAEFLRSLSSAGKPRAL